MLNIYNTENMYNITCPIQSKYLNKKKSMSLESLDKELWVAVMDMGSVESKSAWEKEQIWNYCLTAIAIILVCIQKFPNE